MDAMESRNMFLSGSKWSALQPERAAAADMLGSQSKDCSGRFGNMTDFESARLFRAPLHACMRNFVLCWMNL
jgi:hypothetical protein